MEEKKGCREQRQLSIYVHIPFCRQKCYYCDFLSARVQEQTKKDYLIKLKEEIRCAADKYQDEIADTVFFGGGTPTLLQAEELSDLLYLIKTSFHVTENAEITIEANPGTISREKLNHLRQAGFNRLSIGLQSTNDRELKELGRIHTYDEFVEGYHAARTAGFDNVNVDVMSALPGQTSDSYCDTLMKVLALHPEHISAYSLIIEEGTLFWDRYGDNAKVLEKYPALPTEEEERKMYQMTDTILEKAGYHRYEISNYALKDKECKHNNGYWERKNYIGLGLGASSLYENTRWKNTDTMEAYLTLATEQFVCDKTVLTKEEQMEEFMFLGLRLTQGVSMEKFQTEFGRTIQEVYPGIVEKYIGNGLLNVQNERILLSKKGIDVSNLVMSEFLF
ncbi:MAG: radical SAM family heme chaperone HemW [Lachnospiraceae bacterium]|nr:radical SAM family heme chaperone HemW [Lachnospiraceae bacterium]